MMEADTTPFFVSNAPSSSKLLKWGLGGACFVVFVTMVISFATLGVLVEHDKSSPGQFSASAVDSMCPAPRLGYHSIFDHEEADTMASRNAYAARQKKTVQAQNVLIQNAKIWTGEKEGPFELDRYDILITNGFITEIQQNISPPNGVTAIDVNGAYVTPGLVDMHSHFGVYSYPDDSFGTQDGNEATSPTTPYVRVRDALNAEDPAIAEIRGGGVTYSLILPGSANVMGGQALHVKLRGKTVEEMEIPGSKPAIKMACGENPKRNYGSRNILPSTRMGIGFKQREKWVEAAKLVQLQDQWDCMNASGMTNTPRPFELELQALTAALRGEVLLNVHCYKVEDMLMMIRTANEFNFQIKAFHHAIEAWKLAGVLASEGIGIAGFSEHWGFKMEAYDGSVQQPSILAGAGVTSAFKSDHPVIFARYLMYEAARGHYWGLSERDALETVTLAPAKLVELDHLIGSIAVGKHGDIVVWDRYPFEVGARPTMVFIEGEKTDDFGFPQIPRVVPAQHTIGQCNSGNLASFTVTNAEIHLLDAANTQVTGNVVVENGIITCVGTAAQCPPVGTNINANSGILIPSFVSSQSPIGQQEVAQEANSQDGSAVGNDNSMIRAIDGIRLNNFQNRQLNAVINSGIGVAIVSPSGSSLISGQGCAFYTATGVAVDQVTASTSSSLHIKVGNNAKRGGQTNSVSGQMALLRSLFSANAQNAPFDRVFNGSIPLVAHVNQMDEIASVLRFKKEMNIPRLVIHGGAEAHMLAQLIAAEPGTSVALSPARAQPAGFETWRASEMSSVVLTNAGVRTTLALEELGDTRLLRWEAGFAQSRGLDFTEALATVTRNPAQDYGLYDLGVGQILSNTRANFAVFSANPISLDGYPQLMVSGESVICSPKQF